MPERVPASAAVEGLTTQRLRTGIVAPSDCQQLLEALLDYAVAEFGAAGGALVVYTNAPINARRGVWSPAGLRLLSAWEQGLAGRCGKTSAAEKPTESYLDDGALGRLIHAPILADSRVVGGLTLGFAPAAQLPADYLALSGRVASTFGALASILNGFVDATQKVAQLELLVQIGQSISSTLDLDPLLFDVTGLAASLLDAGAASLLLLDDAGRELIFQVALGEKGAALRQLRRPADKGIAGWVATHGQPLIVNDVANDPRHDAEFDRRTGFQTHSIVCVPLQIKGRILGVLEAVNKRSGDGFEAMDEQLLMTVAGQAAIAIENARLYQSLRAERDRTLRAQELARTELARTLHDGTVQLLAAICMNLEHLKRLIRERPDEAIGEVDAARHLAQQATLQARVLLFELRPLVLETRGLSAALQSYAEQLNTGESFAVKLDAGPLPQRLAAPLERALFAIVQEAISNIRRHAKARRVVIRLYAEAELLHLEVEDDGVGFRMSDVQGSYDRRGSLGLLNMRERAEMVGGTLMIESLSEGRAGGTSVSLTLPLHRQSWVMAGTEPASQAGGPLR